ncbi:alanine racemase [Parahaliea mediterranea]|uniref:Alanine racemase n=1 Tax=Parahaliea mediterranea TaxID=651086 RepID=A0A939IPD6_9GAMM|nr:alanine racemase [Parahaliea mediterranea]MBN7799053.1 alanine racemase [Parahaliea mediterranea]
MSDRGQAASAAGKRALLTRRNMLITGVGMVGAGLLAARKADVSGPRDDYFIGLEKALKSAGIATPTLVVDRARLDANIAALMESLPPGMGYRIVAKSLPSLDLIAYIRAQTGSSRIMTFNLPMLEALSQAMPDADQLIGKPLPAGAARAYMHSGRFTADVRSKVQWLVDSPSRLREYADIAHGMNEPIRVNIELDVGLHRGGVVPGEALASMLRAISADELLTFSGFMGYEPHVAAIPDFGGLRDRQLRKAWNTYQGALDAAREILGAGAVERATRNAAGSPTYGFYEDTRIANEVAVGTALVKPSHYDMDTLTHHVPASFIASPVIKSFNETRIPGLEMLDGVKRAFNPNLDHTVFIYGGNWLADPVDPPGLRYNPTYGRSSNQEMLNGGSAIDLAVDDFVFFRPQQSEAVFLQFGDIAVYEDGKITDFWPVFPASA